MKNAIFLLTLAFSLAACQPADEPASPTATFPAGTLVDLTHAFNEETVYWPTASREFELETEFEGETEAGYYYTAHAFCGAEHGGTHMDAPVHFAEGQPPVDEVPLERLMGPAVVVDVSEQALDDPDYQVQTSDFEAWEAEHGPLPDDVIVLVRTGYGQFYPDRERYMGTAERGEEALEDLHFPGLHPDAAAWLVENRSIRAIGLDTPSIDYGQSTDFAAHQVLFEAEIPAFENVANLDALPPQDFTVIALPMKIEGGSGGPARIVAVLPETDA